MRLLCNNLSFVSFKIIITKFSSSILNICSNNKLAHTTIKSIKTKILIKRIILIIKNITTKKIKNTISRIASRKSKITILKSSFFRFLNYN